MERENLNREDGSEGTPEKEEIGDLNKKELEDIINEEIGKIDRIMIEERIEGMRPEEKKLLGKLIQQVGALYLAVAIFMFNNPGFWKPPQKEAGNNKAPQVVELEDKKDKKDQPHETELDFAGDQKVFIESGITQEAINYIKTIEGFPLKPDIEINPEDIRLSVRRLANNPWGYKYDIAIKIPGKYIEDGNNIFLYTSVQEGKDADRRMVLKLTEKQLEELEKIVKNKEAGNNKAPQVVELEDKKDKKDQPHETELDFAGDQKVFIESGITQEAINYIKTIERFPLKPDIEINPEDIRLSVRRSLANNPRGDKYKIIIKIPGKYIEDGSNIFLYAAVQEGKDADRRMGLKLTEKQLEELEKIVKNKE